MTAQERKEYLAKKAKRKAAREEKRKERYGDKYETMKEKHKEWVYHLINIKQEIV